MKQILNCRNNRCWFFVENVHEIVHIRLYFKFTFKYLLTINIPDGCIFSKVDLDVVSAGAGPVGRRLSLRTAGRRDDGRKQTGEGSLYLPRASSHKSGVVSRWAFACVLAIS